MVPAPLANGSSPPKVNHQENQAAASRIGALRKALPGGFSAALADAFCQSLPRFSEQYHGDFSRWAAALETLPQAGDVRWHGEAHVRLSAEQPPDAGRLKTALTELMPWRKGPFDLFGLHVDTEWRSDWKWSRIAGACPWQGTRVLDVGCGNGYFGWRALAAGAELVIGIDPTLLFCMQHQTINHYANEARHWVLPLRCEELPKPELPAFDRVLSLGVLYHRREPLNHLAELYRQLLPDGVLLLETLIVESGEDLAPAASKQRYANMRNVWHVPRITTVEGWLSDAGFADIACIDVSVTTTEEQRPTPWMTFESLPNWLDPADPSLTIEGFPAPRRAVFRAQRPAQGA